MNDDDGMITVTGDIEDIVLLQLKARAFEVLFSMFYHHNVLTKIPKRKATNIIRLAIEASVKEGLKQAAGIGEAGTNVIVTTRDTEWGPMLDTVIWRERIKL